MSRIAVLDQISQGSHNAQQHSDMVAKHRSSPKVKFTQSEDTLLKKLVSKYGENKWEEIASQIPGRNTRQCHDRWFYYLNPNVKKGPWTEEEEKMLFKCVKEIGPHWVRISKLFEGRTDTQIKNKWNVLKRRMEYDKQFNNANEAEDVPAKCEDTTPKKKIPSIHLMLPPEHMFSVNMTKMMPLEVSPEKLLSPLQSTQNIQTMNQMNTAFQSTQNQPQAIPISQSSALSMSVPNLAIPMPPKVIRKFVGTGNSSGFPYNSGAQTV